MSNQNKGTFSVLKGGPEEAEAMTEAQDGAPVKAEMFTSMSDIGFPSNIHNYNLNKKQAQLTKAKTGELITTDQIQRMMDTSNNWRVRTKTIDELLHDIQDRIQTDPEYMMSNSERFLDFFMQLLGDQNFKIVLNTLNILNMIIGMKQQKERFDRLRK